VEGKPRLKNTKNIKDSESELLLDSDMLKGHKSEEQSVSERLLAKLLKPSKALESNALYCTQKLTNPKPKALDVLNEMLQGQKKKVDLAEERRRAELGRQTKLDVSNKALP